MYLTIEHIGNDKIQFIIDILGFTGRNFEHQWALTQTVTAFNQGLPFEDVHTGIFFVNRRQVLGAQEDVWVMVDGSPKLIPQTGLITRDPKQ